MHRTLRKYSFLFSLTILTVLSAEGYSSACAGSLDDVARHLYQVHAENFYCHQDLTHWDELLSLSDVSFSIVLSEWHTLSQLHSKILLTSSSLSVGRYERDWFYERELINAP
jgi:hypothetical protein